MRFEPDSFRIAAVADLHGNLDAYRRLPILVREHHARAVILAGDLLSVPDGFPSVEEAQRFDANRIAEALGSVDGPVLYIMGNDDLVELEPTSPNLKSLHGRRVEIEPYNFVGYQFSLPFMGGIFEKSEEEIAADLASLEPLVDERTVLVSHSPALGTLDTGILDMHAGSASLRELIGRRPVLAHIHGHVHRCWGRQGRHFNVAAAGALRALVLDISTMQHQWVGMDQDS